MSKIKNTLQHTIHMNNCSVAYLQAGNDWEAFQSLQIALNDMSENSTERRQDGISTPAFLGKAQFRSNPSERNCYRPPHHPTNGMGSTTNGRINAQPYQNLQNKIQSASLHAGQNYSAPDCMVQEQSYLPVFNRALLVGKDITDHDAVSAVILYNIALVHHIRGLNNGLSGLLSRAILFYRMAFDCLRSCRFGRDHSQAALPLIATVYNTAQIRAHLFHIRELRKILDYLRGIMSAKECVMQISQQDFDFFLLSSMCYQPGTELTLSPAA